MFSPRRTDPNARRAVRERSTRAARAPGPWVKKDVRASRGRGPPQGADLGNRRDAVDAVERFEALDDGVLVGDGLVVEHEVERAVADELLALPDELVVLDREALELVRREVGVVVAGVNPRVALPRVLRDDIVDFDGQLLHLQVLATGEVGVDDGPDEFDIAGFEQREGPLVEVLVDGLAHVRVFSGRYKRVAIRRPPHRATV